VPKSTAIPGTKLGRTLRSDCAKDLVDILLTPPLWLLLIYKN